MPLSKALTFQNGHICKSGPTEVQVFYLESRLFQRHLRALLKIVIRIAQTVKGRSKLSCLRASVPTNTTQLEETKNKILHKYFWAHKHNSGQRIVLKF